MRITEISLDGLRPVDAYGPGGFRVEGVWYAASLVISPAGVSSFAGRIDREVLALLFDRAEDIDLVIIGLGADFMPLDTELRAAFEQAGIGVEAMATPAACRTYNMLLAEGRRVAAVLLAL